VERARSWTTGFDLDARDWVTGLTFSATYFNIDFRDRIQSPPPDPNLLNNPQFTYLVTRNPSAAQLSSACNQGVFLLGTTADCNQYPATALLDIRIQNMERVRTQGIDFNSTYERGWAPGSLKLSVEGTYLFRFTQMEGPDSPPEQLLNTQNYPINLKLHGALSWQQRRWGTTVEVNFQNSYRDTISQPNRPVSSYTTFDTQLRYELAPFGTSFLQNTRLELNAINVFNETPPFLNNSIASLGYDQENADPTGRLLSIQLRKAW
jgi:iron complex outermembrane recepter protein